MEMIREKTCAMKLGSGSSMWHGRGYSMAVTLLLNFKVSTVCVVALSVELGRPLSHGWYGVAGLRSYTRKHSVVVPGCEEGVRQLFLSLIL